MPSRAVIGIATLILVTLLTAACGPMVPDLPLLDAIDQNNADAVRGHMEFGTDPNQTFIPPGFPFAGASALHLAVLKDDQEIARILLENGANIDLRARDAFQGSPLEWAVFFGIKEMGVFLVESGADLNAKNGFGTTPLDAATADNPFIPAADLDMFIQDRAFLNQYLSEKGAKSGL